MSERKERDPALEQYFESMKRLWDNEDFQVFVAELALQSHNINSVEDVSPSPARTAEQDLFFRQGQMNVIRTTQNLDKNIKFCEKEYYESLEHGDDNTSLEDPLPNL